jgi:hypothetical protein
MIDFARRELITLLGGAAAAWPLAARAQQPMPLIGVLDSVGAFAVTAFRKGLGEIGFAEGRNVLIDVRTTEQYQLAALAAELVRRQVAVIAAIGGPAAPAAKAATATIPVVFAIGGDPVELGLVTSLNRPGGNVTGVTFFSAQLLQKQVGLLHEVLPKAAVFGVLVNPNNPRAQADATSVEAAVRTLSGETFVVPASTERDLDTAFETLSRPPLRGGPWCNTATTDPRSQRSRVGCRGGQLLTRARSPSYASTCPRSVLRDPLSRLPPRLRRRLRRRPRDPAHLIPVTNVSRQFAIARCVRRDVCRTRPRSP